MATTTGSRVRVGVADMAVTDTDASLVTSGLGSCVAIALYDGGGVGGLLHAMLPAAPQEPDRAAKYVDAGLETMIADMTDLGAAVDDLEAKVAGGASMLNLGNGSPVGEQNVAATEERLSDVGIPIVAAETGGNAGRSVSFEPATTTMTIQRVDEAETTI
jgi:chemotaxis protein CheD